MFEPQLKKRFNEGIKVDFDVFADVKGRHLIERKEVVIDFLIRPKQHLLKAGFENDWVPGRFVHGPPIVALPPEEVSINPLPEKERAAGLTSEVNFPTLSAAAGTLRKLTLT